MTALRIQKIQIEDDLFMQDQGAIEVTVRLSDGRSRWCYFMTPAAIEACGDWIDGTRIRFHFGARYMIVVAGTLTEDLIIKALRSIEKQGELLDCTMAIDQDEDDLDETTQTSRPAELGL